MTPIDIACRHCAQQPGEKCMEDLVLRNMCAGRVPVNYFHAERIEDAASLAAVVDPSSEDTFDKAVDESGLV